MNYKPTRAQDVSRMCLICGRENSLGLHAHFWETKEGELIGSFHVKDEHQSYPGRTHGGISAAILDELIGRAVNITEPDVWGVTIELSCKYRKPVPHGCTVTARGRITRSTSRVFEGTGEIVLEDGTVAVEAQGRYLKMPIEHIADGADAESVEEQMFPDPHPIPEFITIPTPG